ncbi:hypothetical protein ES288_D10G059400v1 [Gossypium darwinii]|uniref:Retrotransposon gag domain-containing protein n=1 Tax=Gossypium darwinii TaxID=34276 RepID=A0A5D2B069_GOSDA|nr:hypothetical protein ES288_D10G059400v1 [Gossypium darwinii]
MSHLEALLRPYKIKCPRFGGTDFRGWWLKLEQYFKVEGVIDSAKVKTVMLHLEMKVHDRHHFYTQN